MSSSRLPKKRRQTTATASEKKPLLRNPMAIGAVAIGAIVGVVLLIVLVAANSGGGGSDLPAVPLGELQLNNRTLGSDSAPVTIYEISDYQCPFCGMFANQYEPQLKKDYIDSGKVRLEFRNLAFLGNESVNAAEAAECANDQGKYWDYHYKLFKSQNGENKGAFSINNLKKFASDLGLDRSQFDQCLDSNKYEANIKQEKASANDFGINSTPSFVINGDKSNVVHGADYAKLKAAIDAALAKSGQ